MRAGKHVLCEKPIALTVAEIDEMAAVSRQTGRVLAEAFMYRHHPQMKAVGEWVRSGRLGEIHVVRGVLNFKIKDRGPDVRLVPEYGGGALWDVGVYPVSFAQYIYGGPPQRVFGAQWLGDTGVDEVFTGQLRFSGDRMAQTTCALKLPACTSAEVLGSEGRLEMDMPFVWHEGIARLLYYPEGDS
jgi:predicted dehydrogenase